MGWNTVPISSLTDAQLTALGYSKGDPSSKAVVDVISAYLLPTLAQSMGLGTNAFYQLPDGTYALYPPNIGFDASKGQAGFNYAPLGARFPQWVTWTPGMDMSKYNPTYMAQGAQAAVPGVNTAQLGFHIAAQAGINNPLNVVATPTSVLAAEYKDINAPITATAAVINIARDVKIVGNPDYTQHPATGALLYKGQEVSPSGVAQLSAQAQVAGIVGKPFLNTAGYTLDALKAGIKPDTLRQAGMSSEIVDIVAGQTIKLPDGTVMYKYDYDKLTPAQQQKINPAQPTTAVQAAQLQQSWYTNQLPLKADGTPDTTTRRNSCYSIRS